MKGLIDELQTIPSELPTNPLPTLKITFDAKREKNFYELAKKFGKLNITDVNLSLLPKDPKTLDLDSVS